MSQSLNVQPSFEAEKITGKFKRTIMVFEEDVKIVPDGKGGERKIITRQMVPVQEEFDEAYMIYFPQGHSIRVPAHDTKQLERIGVFGPPKYIDMNTGDEVPVNATMSPKQLVAAKTRSKGRETGGIETAMEV